MKNGKLAVSNLWSESLPRSRDCALVLVEGDHLVFRSPRIRRERGQDRSRVPPSAQSAIDDRMRGRIFRQREKRFDQRRYDGLNENRDVNSAGHGVIMPRPQGKGQLEFQSRPRSSSRDGIARLSFKQGEVRKLVMLKAKGRKIREIV